MERTTRKKNGVSLFLIVLIGLHFLWNGSAYISQMYRLASFLPPERVDVVVLRFNYLAQAVGILVYAFLAWKLPRFTGRRLLYPAAAGAGAISIFPMLYGASAPLIIASGLVMNLLFGFCSAMQFRLLSLSPHGGRARTFALGYAIGTLGTFFLSLLGGGAALNAKHIALVYAAMAALNVALFLIKKPAPPDGAREEKPLNAKPSIGTLSALGLCLLMMAVISSVSADYKSASVLNGPIDLAMVRAFYALGFLAAGFVSDRSRRAGAILCLMSLCFNFLLIFLYRESSLLFLAWSLSYFLLAFYSVYRGLVFSDIAAAHPALEPLAGLGLCIARVGEALSTYFNAANAAELPSVLLVSAMLAALVALFLPFYAKSYLPVSVDAASRSRAVETKHGLSAREREVFRELLKGSTNGEIAAALFISENTVKFHMKNILKKTGAASRAEIVDMADGEQK